jgi:hypothetical protein
MARIFDFFRRGSVGGGDGEAVRHLALTEIKRTWSADESDLTTDEHGFNWLPGSHRVQVRIHRDERDAIGPRRYRITIETDFLRSVPVRKRAFVDQTTVMVEALCPTFSAVYPPAELVEKYFGSYATNMQFFSSAYIDELTAPWLSGFVARMSVLQAIFAEQVSESMQHKLGGAVPQFAGGQRNPTPREVLLLDQLIRISGAMESRWTDSTEFEEFAEEHARNDMCFGFGEASSLTLETPFGSDSALIQFKTNEPYPPLGSGLAVETRIRLPHTYEEVCDKAAWLNYLESVQWTDFPQLGRWYPEKVAEDTTLLVHGAFVPNEYFAPGLVTNYGLWAITRAQWARTILLPNAKNLTMREILKARFGK